MALALPALGVVPRWVASASPGSLLEMEHPGPQPDLLRVSRVALINLCLNKAPGDSAVG